MKFTRKQWVLAGLVGLLVIDQLSLLFLRSYELSAVNLLSLFSTLASIAVYLKLMLPSPAPHRKWLGILLGLSLASSISAIILHAIEGFPSLATGYELAFALGYLISVIWGLLALTVLSAYFWLLISIIRRKTTHKIATVMAFVGAALFILDVPAAALSSLIDPNFQMAPLIWMIIPAVQVLILAIVLLKHPVLERPILAPAPPPPAEPAPTE